MSFYSLFIWPEFPGQIVIVSQFEIQRDNGDYLYVNIFTWAALLPHFKLCACACRHLKHSKLKQQKYLQVQKSVPTKIRNADPQLTIQTMKSLHQGLLDTQTPKPAMHNIAECDCFSIQTN